MKFTCSVDVDLPRDKVVALMKDPNNFKEWQDGFVSLETISGEKGAVGSKSRAIYKMGKKGEMELIETILVNDLPDKFVAKFDHVHMTNLMTNTFTELTPNKTRYESHIEYTKFKGLMIRIIAFIMPGMFKKQTQKWLNQFKVFAERQENE